MDFFRTPDGYRHAGRIVAVIYAVGLIPGIILDGFTAVNAMRLLYTAGWWLAFGDKRPVQTIKDVLQNACRLTGVVLIVVGLFGSFYVRARHRAAARASIAGALDLSNQPRDLHEGRRTGGAGVAG
jgi:hypothetical protein